jgi:hypothetical protein
MTWVSAIAPAAPPAGIDELTAAIRQIGAISRVTL